MCVFLIYWMSLINFFFQFVLEMEVQMSLSLLSIVTVIQVLQNVLELKVLYVSFMCLSHSNLSQISLIQSL